MLSKKAAKKSMNWRNWRSLRCRESMKQLRCRVKYKRVTRGAQVRKENHRSRTFMSYRGRRESQGWRLPLMSSRHQTLTGSSSHKICCRRHLSRHLASRRRSSHQHQFLPLTRAANHHCGAGQPTLNELERPSGRKVKNLQVDLQQ